MAFIRLFSDARAKAPQGPHRSFLTASRAFPFLLAAGLLVMLPGLQGCANRQASLLGSVRSLVKPNEAVDAARLRPDLRYLRVTVDGRAMLMVLGYVDKDAQGRSVQVWYSGEGDVLRTQAGRLVGLTGGPVEWLNVRLPADLPAWSDLKSEHRFVRQLDEMPGYHWRRADQLSIKPVATQSSMALAGLPAQTLTWFEERAVHEEGGHLPPARYALMHGVPEPVYGEQCLSQSYCLSWQVWPPQTVAPQSTP